MNRNPNSTFNAHNTDLNGFYRQVVVSNSDPLFAGRLQVNIYGITDSIQKEDLPWADPLIPFVGEGYGDIKLPQVGSNVFVLFEQGNIYQPFYFAQIQKNTNKGYLPDYDKYKKEDQGNVFITKYPAKFNPPNQFEQIIYETNNTAEFKINSVYQDDRFTIEVKNNTNHNNHITVEYKGNDTIITENSTPNSSTFNIEHGIDFKPVNIISMTDSNNGQEIYIQTTNNGNKQKLDLSTLNSKLLYNTSFIMLTNSQIILGGGQSNVYIGAPTENPTTSTDLSLQYAQALQEVRNKLQELINLYNSHTHIGNLGAPTAPTTSQDVFTGFNETLGTNVTKAW